MIHGKIRTDLHNERLLRKDKASMQVVSEASNILASSYTNDNIKCMGACGNLKYRQ